MPQGNAFDFLQRPPRDRKPRKRGLTVASDRGVSLAQAQSIIETMGDILDHIKCPDHVGNMWRWPADWIKKKNAYYSSVGIHTLPGGITVGEIFDASFKVSTFVRGLRNDADSPAGAKPDAVGDASA